MKKILLISCILGLVFSVHAKDPKRKSASMMTPMMSYVSAYEVVLKYALEKSEWSFMEIKSIKASPSDVKLELLDSNGNCKAFAFEISADNMGMNRKAKLKTNAVVTCQ